MKEMQNARMCRETASDSVSGGDRKEETEKLSGGEKKDTYLLLELKTRHMKGINFHKQIGCGKKRDKTAVMSGASPSSTSNDLKTAGSLITQL